MSPGVMTRFRRPCAHGNDARVDHDVEQRLEARASTLGCTSDLSSIWEFTRLVKRWLEPQK
jgi:hypothetical protein